MPNDAGSELVNLTPAPADPYGVEAEFDPELDAPVEESIGRTANTPPPAPKPAAPASAEPTIHKHSRRLLREATEFGISQDEIDSTPSEELDEKVYQMRREAFAWARQQGQRDILDAIKTPGHASSGVAPPEPGVPGGTAAQGSAPAPGGAGDEISLTANDDDYDPELVGAIKRLFREQRAEIKALKEQVGHLHAAEGRRASETLTQQVDRAFADLGPGYEPFFGKGGVAEIDEGALARRKALLAHVEQAMKGKPGTLGKKIAEAAKLLYPVPPASPAAEYGAGVEPAPRPVAPPAKAPERAAAEERWRGAGLAHPTNRESPEPRGQRRAEKTAAAYMRENGMLDEGGDEMDGFL